MKRLFERGWFKWVAFPAMALFLAVVVGAVIIWYAVRIPGTSVRDSATAELDANDSLWRTSALTEARNAALPAAEQNAAVHSVQAHKQIAKSYSLWAKDERWRGELKPGHLPHPEDIQAARAALGDSKTAIDTARRIRHLPAGGLPLTFKEPDVTGTLLPDTQNMREVASILQVDALVRAYDRKGDEAAESAHAILAIGRGLGDEPTLISQLVRIAIGAISVQTSERVLGWSVVSEPRLAEMQAAFAGEATAPRMKAGLRGERAMMFRLMENIDNGSMSMSQLMDGMRVDSSIEQFANVPLRATIPEQQATLLRMMNRMIAATDLPYGPARDAEMTASEAELKTLPRYRNVLVFLLLPALMKVSEADTRINAQMNCASVAMACERYRLKHKKYPESLADLPKDLLPETPTDPYSGKPVQYRKTDDGCVVYAFGPDRIDNGGEAMDRGYLKGDITFRLFTPDHRRKPPLPKEDPTHPPGVVVPPADPEGSPPAEPTPPPPSKK